MAINTAAGKNAAAVGGYTNLSTYAALFTTVPGATAGTEVTGGSPAYARLAITWGTATNGVITGTTTTPFNVPSGATIAGFGLFTAATGGTYVDGASVTSQAFSAQGTYNLTITFTEV